MIRNKQCIFRVTEIATHGRKCKSTDPQTAEVMLRAYWNHTVLYLPFTRFIPARAEQDLEHDVCDESLNVAAYFSDLGKVEA
jgi:hypothetical protein